jgi:hypothetical protein
MKKITLLISIIISQISFSQLTKTDEFDIKYDTNNDLNYVLLSSGKIIYYNAPFSNGKYNNKIDILNTDGTIFKTVNLPKIKFDTTGQSSVNASINYLNFSGIDIQSVSDKIFNNDDKIEFIITINARRENTYSRYSYLINEDGNLLQEFELIDNKERNINSSFSYYTEFYLAEKKLIVRGDKKVTTYTINGELPWPFKNISNSTTNLKPIETNKNLHLNSYPNPNSGKVIIEYELPLGIKNGEIKIFNQSGQIIKKLNVNYQEKQIEVSTDELPSGTYFYELDANGNNSGTKKMIVIE